MKKLIRGILNFREVKRDSVAETFHALALGQKPDALLIACSDSRVAVNIFASDDPGDLFVVRNVGNLVPPHDDPGNAGTAAAVDFAVDYLKVKDIIVCGHSDCGAMRAHWHGHQNLPPGPLRNWLEIGATCSVSGRDENELSRCNVLEQLAHLASYPSVARAMRERGLGLHGLWFDITNVDVLYYEASSQEWTVLDTENGTRIMAGLRAES